uniref:Mediator of RNA polymerase II transcription subunit 19 n=1 Tax=Meloidogyne javanica TaxID=6303 RepID=A0A915MG78_MELJA
MVEHTGTSSGFLRTKISLKGNQSQLSLVSPFYGMKPELPPSSQLLGSEDLISLLDLNGSYNRYCGPKKPKEDLASFLPHVCGATQINKKADASCSLRQLIEKPPVMGKEINNLTAGQMTGFKLAPGPVPDGYRYFDLTNIPIELATTSVIQQQQQSVIDPNLQKDNGIDIRYGTRVKRSLDELDALFLPIMSFDLSHLRQNDLKSFKVFRRSQCFAKLFEAIIRNFGRCQAFDYKPMAQHKQMEKRQQNFTFVDALADVTVLSLDNATLFYEIHDMYFSVTILLIALTLGEIIGNLWTEFAWAPQLAVYQALTVILLLPLQLSVERIHETIKQRRSDLYVKIFFIGFSMGRLCDYNLMLNAPKIICPMVFCILIDKFGVFKDDDIDLLQKQSHCSSPIRFFTRQEESRLDLFIGLVLTVNGILFYYGLNQLLQENSTIQRPIWSFGATNPWLANADLVYPEESLTPISTKKRYSTSVETKRLSKNTKNVLKNEKTNETISIPPMRDLDGLQKNAVDPDTKPFYHGNPFVEKHRGVMRLHKENLESSEHPPINNCCMLVMMD